MAAIGSSSDCMIAFDTENNWKHLSEQRLEGKEVKLAWEIKTTASNVGAPTSIHFAI